MYYINGIFWKTGRVPGIDATEQHYAPSKEEEEVSVNFHGIVDNNPQAPSPSWMMNQYTSDIFGFAEILAFKQKERGLRFVRRYESQEYIIIHKLFRGLDDVYVGYWEVMSDKQVLARGPLRCVLTPIPEQLFKKPKVSFTKK